MQCMIIMSKMQPFPNTNSTEDIIINNQQQTHQNPHTPSSSSSSTSNLSPSILTISLILIITLLLTVSLILLIRRFRHQHHHHPSSSTTTSSVLSSHRHVSNEDSALIDSLPLFSFSSASCSSGDCAVCLSKFQPHDQLRLLPLCCHAFHAPCVDSWLRSNLTCPLCRSTVVVSASHDDGGSSFRLEIGSVSHRRSDSSDHRRSYSMGSFDYVVESESEVAYARSSFSGGKAAVPPSTPPDEERLAADVADGRSWARECMDRVAASVSFRSSGRFFTGSSRRSNVGDVAEMNLEAGSIGDEITELFRWASGV